MGEPGFPIPLRMRAGGPRTQAPAPGRVWEGYALPRTIFCGEPLVLVALGGPHCLRPNFESREERR